MITEEKVIEILKQCYDPEIPIDLYNLGLIYEIKIQEAFEKNKSDINIIMSLTTPGCTMGQYMSDDIKSKVERLNGINNATVEVTFDPPWEPEMMTDEARVKLGVSKDPSSNHKSEWE